MADRIDLARIIASVQIDDIRLREGSCRSLFEAANLPEELSASLSHETAVNTDLREGVAFLISVRFLLEVRREPNGDDVLAEVGAVFDLSYHVPTDENFSAEEIEGFGQFNAVFNAWPYWREFVQTSMSRMAMPGLTVPLYRLPRRESAKVEATQLQTPTAAEASASRRRR
jgi:hypothetical protein